MFTSLLNYTPSVEPVYDDRAKAMEIMVIIIAILAILAFMFFVLFLHYKFNKNSSTSQAEQSQNELSSEELNVVANFRKLSETDKTVISQMLNSLNKNDLNKE